MAVLSEQILEAAGKRPEGFLLAAKQFLGLGNRAAEDQDPKARLHSGSGKPPPTPAVLAKVSSGIHDESRSAYQEAALQGPNVTIQRCLPPPPAWQSPLQLQKRGAKAQDSCLESKWRLSC